MIPNAGTYYCDNLSYDQFIEFLLHPELLACSGIQNFIGYPANLDLLRKWTAGQIDLAPCKDLSLFDKGDVAIVMKLKYRVSGSKAGLAVSEDDFQFCIVERIE